VLVTALLFATVIGLGLVGYLALSQSALKLAQRTLYLGDAGNLAEAGLEEALYCFKQLDAGTTVADAWTGWIRSGANATRTLAPFNRDQNAIGTVKIFVKGYDGADADAYIISQATIATFDRSPAIVKTLRIGLKQSGIFNNGAVGLGGLKLNGQPTFDSFNSNPSGSLTGPWVSYSSAIARANNSVIVPSGKIDLGNGQIMGNLSVGSGVTAPPASQVNGTIQTNYTGTFTMPAYPTAASVSKSYNLGSKLPATLPAAGHKPAADGKYYYFVSGATINDTTIAAGKDVVIVGTKTGMSAGLTVDANATCAIYMDGKISASGKGSIENNNWAGALQIFTTTTGSCELSGNGELKACLYAPYAALKVAGGSKGGGLVGSFVAKTITASGQVDFHYDEALRKLNTGGGSSRKPTMWAEIRTGSDRAALGALTGNFLP
jgi:hypothetical protein